MSAGRGRRSQGTEIPHRQGGRRERQGQRKAERLVTYANLFLHQPEVVQYLKSRGREVSPDGTGEGEPKAQHQRGPRP